jgi:hypothetical protein
MLAVAISEEITEITVTEKNLIRAVKNELGTFNKFRCGKSIKFDIQNPTFLKSSKKRQGCRENRIYSGDNDPSDAFLLICIAMLSQLRQTIL